MTPPRASQRSSEFWLCYRPFDDRADVVRLVDRARAAIVVDTARRALTAGFGRVRLFSTEPLDGLPPGVNLERTDPRQRVGDIVAAAAQGASGPVCYAGSGMPAMTAADWSDVRAAIESGAATANRVFSCDWLGAPDGRLLGAAAGAAIDNRFALLVRDRGRLPLESFARSARTLLDVDTPADLVVLKTAIAVGSLDVGPMLRDELARQPQLDEAIDIAIQVFETMTQPDQELFVAGRVSGADWAVVDRDTSCRVRVLSEERGLRSRGAPGRSLLAALHELCGLCEQSGGGRFTPLLDSLADAVIWDTRPFWSQLGWNLSRGDRFAADLGSWADIQSAPLRELTRALSGAAAPILIGGHSLVSGGLLAAIDAAWARRELSG